NPHINPKFTAMFSGQSMLGIPFITQRQKLGTLLLGYKDKHIFTQEELFQAQITSEQVAPVLSKLLLLEEERKQLRRLRALHDVALTSTQLEDEDR
ncbi:hypothetical protein P6O75_14895, partial [Clostridium perfringens]|nr:hypothetical protein [Clostridium perfringens]